MRTIWKFPLSMRGWQVIPIGPEAKVVLCGIDPADGGPAIWVEHEVPKPDPGKAGAAMARGALAEGPRYFGVFGTGHELPEDADHRGSMIDRSFVWHIYERRP